MRHLFSRLRSYFILDPLVFAYTVVMGAGSLLSSLVDKSGRIQHRFAVAWSWMILKTCFSPVTVVNSEHLAGLPPCVVAPNHISAMDIPVLYTSLPFQFRIVANKNLFDYPFMGWHMRRSGQVPIDRTSPRATFKSLSKAVHDLAEGLSVVIFPEGGRAPDGHLQPFMIGAFYLAVKAQAPVLPVAIVGTFEMLPMDTFHIMPQPLKLVIGEPIPTTGLTTHDLESLSEHVRVAVADLYYSHAALPDPRQNSVTASSETSQQVV